MVFLLSDRFRRLKSDHFKRYQQQQNPVHFELAKCLKDDHLLAVMNQRLVQQHYSKNLKVTALQQINQLTVRKTSWASSTETDYTKNLKTNKRKPEDCQYKNHDARKLKWSVGFTRITTQFKQL